jgi:hypothetical protein
MVGQLLEDLFVIKEVFEDPAAAHLDHSDAPALQDHVEGFGLYWGPLLGLTITIIRNKSLGSISEQASAASSKLKLSQCELIL